MKKKLAVLLSVMVLTMTTVSAAETQGPVSKWLNNLTGKVAKKEQAVNKKSQTEQQKLAAKKKAQQEKVAKQKAKAQQKKLENLKKAAEHKKKIQTKKKQLKDLFTIDK